MKRLTPFSRRFAPFGLLWLAASAPLLLYLALYRSSAAALLGFVGQLLVACCLAALPLPRRAVRWGLLGALTLVVAGGALERDLSKTRWQVSDKTGLWHDLTAGDTVTGYGFRSWRAPHTDGARLSLEVRLVSGTPAWDWFRSDARFRLEPQTGPDYPHTRVWAPPAASGRGSPYLMRTYDTRAPISGRIFRVLLDLRRAPHPGTPEGAAAGTAPTTPERGNPIGGRDCRGIMLQAWAERGGGRCLPVTLTDAWTRYSLSWRVPDELDVSVVRIVLGGFAGETFDVRRTRLFNGRGPLGPLLPQGGAAQLVWGGRPEAHGGRSFMPGPDWRQLSVKLPPRPAGAPGFVTAHLYTASGLTLATRNVTVMDGAGRPLPAAVSSARQTVLFGDPNLAGHTLGTLGLALVALSPPPLGVVGGGLTFAGLALTGSRAALFGTLCGLLWLFWLWLPRGARRLGFAALGLAALGLVGLAWPELSALRLFSLGEAVSRGDIWRAAWAAFLAEPLRGLGAGGFGAFWAEFGGADAAVGHAHNVWLEFAAGYGVLGLLSIVTLTLGLGALAWQRGGARAAAFVAGVLAMNVFDTTLVYGGVLFPLLLALGALPRTEVGVQRGVPNRRLRTLNPGFTPRLNALHPGGGAEGHNNAVSVRPSRNPRR